MDETIRSAEAPGDRKVGAAAAKLSRAELAEATRRRLVKVNPNGCLEAEVFDSEVLLGLRNFSDIGSMPMPLANRWLIC